jgi:hypothetical protein
MNPELASALQIGLVAAKFALIAGLIGWMIYKSRVFMCPRCRAGVRVSEIRLTEIRCPKCDWNVSRVAPASAPAAAQDMSASTCRKCSRHGEGTTLIPLWDGHGYCQACLDAAHPRLAELARTNESLVEVLPFSLARSIGAGISLTTILATMIVGGGLAMMAIVTLFVILTRDNQLAANNPLPEDGIPFAVRMLMGAFMMFGIVWPFFATVAFPMTLGMHWWQLPRTVSVRDGKLKIQPPGDRYYELADVRWAETTSRFDALLSTVWPRRAGIVLFPHRGDEENKYRTVKVGYIVGLAPDMFSVWKAFLTLAGVTVQETRPWRSPAPR